MQSYLLCRGGMSIGLYIFTYLQAVEVDLHYIKHIVSSFVHENTLLFYYFLLFCSKIFHKSFH